MTTTTTRTKLAIQSEIKTLAALAYLVGTNDGTYGAAEAAAAMGTGDPAHTTRRVYETVGGEQYATGPSEERMPGRMRHLQPTGLTTDRKALAALKAELKVAK